MRNYSLFLRISLFLQNTKRETEQRMDNYLKIEQKLGFEKVRESVALRCSTQYARERVAAEKVSLNPQTIEKRLILTDEMRLICLFETAFPASGFIDSIDYLKPLEVESTAISLENLNKLATFLENLRGVLNFFKGCKEENYPHLKAMAAPILFYPEPLQNDLKSLQSVG